MEGVVERTWKRGNDLIMLVKIFIKNNYVHAFYLSIEF